MQDDEFVAAPTRHQIARTDRRAEPAGDLARSLSPVRWPRLSLTCLKSSRSRNITSTRRSASTGSASAAVRAISNERRLRRLVTESKCAMRSMARSALRLAVTSCTTMTQPPREFGVRVMSKARSSAVSNSMAKGPHLDPGASTALRRRSMASPGASPRRPASLISEARRTPTSVRRGDRPRNSENLLLETSTRPSAEIMHMPWDMLLIAKSNWAAIFSERARKAISLSRMFRKRRAES